MIQKSIYIISLFAIIILTFMTVEMLPLIYQTKWQGFLYLFLLFVLLISELFIFIKNPSIIKESTPYNFLVISTAMYLSIIYYKIYSIKADGTFLYHINLKYCKDHYLLLSVALTILIINLKGMIKMDKKKL